MQFRKHTHAVVRHEESIQGVQRTGDMKCVDALGPLHGEEWQETESQ